MNFRESLILLLMIYQPRLTWKYCNDLTALQFSDPEASALQDALLTWPPAKAVTRNSEFEPILKKLHTIAADASRWYLKEADADEILKQAITIQKRANALQKELLLAELDLGKDRKRIEDIRAHLKVIGGIDAAIEGNGKPRLKG